MSQKISKPATGVGFQVGAVLLLVATFALIGFVALSVVTGNDFGVGSSMGLVDSGLRNVPSPSPLRTPNPAAMANFKHTALGFSLQYPRSWRKSEQGLQVILSPSANGLALDTLRDSVIWFGIPADSTVDPAQLKLNVQQEIFPTAKILKTGTRRIDGESWQYTELRFESDAVGPMSATIATTSKNEVGYFMVAVAPAAQWNSIQGTYNSIINSFHFTTEAVLRATDATPPPTPTPTPTPVFYIIKSGDTLSHVSVQYGVSIEALMDRNGLDESSVIHPGDKLLIPRKRQR